MRTFGPDVLPSVARSMAVVLCVLALASCSSGGSDAEAANPCGVSPPSQEEELAREILGTRDFETKADGSTERLVDKMERALPVIGPDKHVFFTEACDYSTDQAGRQVQATFVPGWLFRTSEEPLLPGQPYSVNGVRGASGDSRSGLVVACDMPGELREASQKVWFTADITFTSSPSLPKVDQAERDRRMTLTYLMARRVTDALGCENKPLAKPPVVKPLPTP